MAKEQVHHWLRTAVILAGIVFAGGGYVMKISAMDKSVINNKEKIERVADDVVNIRLDAKDTHALAAAAARSMQIIETRFGVIQTQLSNQATIQAINSTKLESLTKGK